MKQNSNVPAFLSKLWTLVEGADANEFITWSQNGQSFLVLDEQRFAKEILPKYFKHNNMASFVRQLNMYGFRKVVHVDSGIIKQERDGPVEFKHPYFKQGQDELLENIKRKVSSARPEETKMRPEDLSEILNSANNVQAKQEAIETMLCTLKRENEALWREVGDLQAKHSQQQQIIRKIIQFIVTLVQNNRLVNLKRKRPLLLNNNGSPKSNQIQQIIKEPAGSSSQTPVKRSEGLKKRGQITDDIIIYDVTDDMVEDEEEEEIEANPTASPDTHEDAVFDLSSSPHMPDIVIVEDDEDEVLEDDVPVIQDDKNEELLRPECHDAGDASPLMSSAVKPNSQSSLIADDPVKMMDSILSESGAISQNINLLGKVELMDYLDSIDCSLEDFHAMLSGRQFSIDPDLLQDARGVDPMKNGRIHTGPEEIKSASHKSDKQLIQYTTFPLLAFLDGSSTVEVGGNASAAASSSSSETTSTLDKPQLDEFLESSLDTEPTQSKLVRLEPLTEAEASEATLFYLCELAPATLDGDTPLLEN
ncbi:heat shock factor protein 2 isoform X2 [Microcaecilia unicolor]|uniref:Heat shock factor protein 2 isoform X2 n=1 Tax=Microcaecilia unicolor TaxID=1415580 RepID=A0A6P7XFX6_9AMPH|nr:heat shock factor protein 2 isoform X2 [Microcaecilia unicolor]